MLNVWILDIYHRVLLQAPSTIFVVVVLYTGSTTGLEVAKQARKTPATLHVSSSPVLRSWLDSSSHPIVCTASTLAPKPTPQPGHLFLWSLAN